jgi:phosphorylase kinase alpha/beta subunit
MFNCYLAISNIFSNNLVKAQEYYEKTLSLVRHSILPFNFYVPKEYLDEARNDKSTSERIPSAEVYDNSAHLWTQSIWIILQLLVDKMISLQELDPLRRYLQPNERPKQSKRYSSFKVNSFLNEILVIIK